MSLRLHHLTLSVVLTAMSLSATAAREQRLGPAQYAAATALLQDRPYCIEKLCLGAGIAEVRPLGVLFWRADRMPSNGWKCGLGENIASGYLQLTDGRQVSVQFSKVSPEGGEEQYRLTGFGVPISDGLSGLQLQYMAKQVAERWKLPEGKPNVSWYGNSPGNLMTVMLSIGPATPFGSRKPYMEIAATAMLRGEEDWLMSLPECRSGLPKL